MPLSGRKLQHRLVILNPKCLAIATILEAINNLPDFIVLQELYSIEDAYQNQTEEHPDLMLWVDAGNESIVDNIGRLYQHIPKTPIVVMMMNSIAQNIPAAFTAGARGYILHDSLPDLECVLRLAAKGGFACCAASSARLSNQMLADQHLSMREQQVAAQISFGQSNDQIALLLSLKRSTVETHIDRILRRIGGRSRVDIATWWQRFMMHSEEGLQKQE